MKQFFFEPSNWTPIFISIEILFFLIGIYWVFNLRKTRKNISFLINNIQIKSEELEKEETEE